MKRSSSQLRVAQWNCRSLMAPERKITGAKLAAFQRFSRAFDIIIVVETWLKPDRGFEVAEGFSVIRKDREQQGGGVAIVIRNGLQYKRISCVDHPMEFLAIKVIGKTIDIVIVACYRAPGNDLTPQEWNDFFKEFENHGCFVLAGDFNAHHTMWNCVKVNSEGNKLLKVIRRYNCKVHNTTDRSHVGNKRSPDSNIDLFITDSELADCVKARQLDDAMGSDHFPIECVIDFEYLINDKCYPRSA